MNQRKVGVVLQYIQIILNIVLTLIYSPIMLRILGQNEYGLYSIAASTISFLSLLSLGLGGSYLRYYSIYKAKEDQEGIARLNGLYLIVFSILGSILLIAGLSIAFNAQILFNSTYSSSDITIAKTLLIILSVNLALSFPLSVFSSYITSQEKFLFQKTLNIIATILGPCINIILLYCGFASIGIVVASLSLSVVVAIINIFYCFKKIKMRIIIGKIDFVLLKDIFIFSLFIAINQIIEQITWQTDKVILGKMINASVVAIYAVGSQINNLFTQFSSAISSVFAPKVNLIVQKNETTMDEELSNLFIKVGRIQWFVLLLIFSGFIFFGKYFVLRWAGEGYDNSYFVALILMAPAIIPLIQNVGIEIQRAKNKHQIRSIVYLIIAIINVFISIYFATLWGEIGCAIGTAIALLLGPVIFMNIYYQVKLNIDIVRFWKEILKTLPGFLIPVSCGVVLMIFYSFHSLLDFSLLILAYCVVYSISIYFFSFNKIEKRYISAAFSKIASAFKKR